MAESNKMKEMPVNKLMIQMGIPMILSMALQAVYNIVESAFVGNMRVGISDYGSHFMFCRICLFKENQKKQGCCFAGHCKKIIKFP